MFKKGFSSDEVNLIFCPSELQILKYPLILIQSYIYGSILPQTINQKESL